MSWFRRDKLDTSESLDPQFLLAQAHREQVPARSSTGSFRLTVVDVFSIAGRGTVVTGQVEAGSVTVGSRVTLTRPDGTRRNVTITGIEMFRRTVDTATVGDNVGLLLSDIARSEIGAGDLVTS